MGSEDFSLMVEGIPQSYYFLGMKDDDEQHDAMWHEPRFDWNDRVTPGAALLWKRIILDFFENS